MLPLLLIALSLSLGAAPHRFRVHPHPTIGVLDILEAPDGDLWLATESGLVAFDGFRYRPVPDFPFPAARRLARTADGALWIGGPKGLARFSAGRFTVVLSDPVVELTAVGSYLIVKCADASDRLLHPDGRLTVPDLPRGAYLTADGDTAWIAAPPSLAATRVRPPDFHTPLETASFPSWFPQVRRDRAGRLWGADPTRAVLLSSPVTQSTRRASKRFPRVAALLPGHDGQVWFLGETIRGLAPDVTLEEPPEFHPFLPTAGFQDAHGHLWVARHGLGLVEWIPDPGWSRWSTRDFGGMPVSQIVRGPAGLFAATHNNIYRLDGDSWRPLPVPQREYASILPLPDGGFLASIRRFGLAHLSPTGAIVESIPNPLPSNDGYRLLSRDGHGRLWAANKSTLFSITGAPGALRLLPVDLPNTRPDEPAQPVDLVLDPAGNPWVVSAVGLAALQPDGRWLPIPTSEPILNPRSLTLAGPDEIWVSFRFGDSFARLRRDGSLWRVTRFRASAGFGPADTHFLKSDSRGWLWRGSPDGVHLSSGRATAPHDWLLFSPRTGLSAGAPGQYGFFEDNDGSVWIAGESGVTRITPDPAWFHSPAGPAPRVSSIHPNDPAGLRLHLSGINSPFGRTAPIAWRLSPSQSAWSHTASASIEIPASAPAGSLEIRFAGDGPAPALSLAVHPPPAPFSPWLLALPAGALCWFATPFAAPARYRLRKAVFLLRRRLRPAPDEPILPAPADLDGRYRPIRALSSGGFSDVLLAAPIHPLGPPVAVKRLHPLPGREGWVRDRFAHEVAALRSVQHPGVVPILDSWISPHGQPCLVMPFLEGPTLRESLRPGPLPAAVARAVIRRLADALDAIHAKGIVHRDLKPENIILPAPDQPVIIDFGASSLRGPLDALASTTLLSGSFHYMAPERLSGHYSPASDIYSLAVIALEILTGKRLDTLPPVPSSEFPAALSVLLGPTLAVPLRAALDPNPALRPAAAATLAAALQP